jgi:hypothetical protein
MAPSVRQSSPVLRRDASRTDAEGAVQAVFTAVSGGTAVIHADHPPPGCAGSTSPCPAAAPATPPFDVTVVVSG